MKHKKQKVFNEMNSRSKQKQKMIEKRVGKKRDGREMAGQDKNEIRC